MGSDKWLGAKTDDASSQATGLSVATPFWNISSLWPVYLAALLAFSTMVLFGLPNAYMPGKYTYWMMFRTVFLPEQRGTCIARISDSGID